MVGKIILSSNSTNHNYVLFETQVIMNWITERFIKIFINGLIFPLLFHMRAFTRWFVSDRLFAIVYYFHFMQRLPNIDNPVRYTEKIQWYKLHGGLDEYSSLVDKYKVRSFISKTIGDAYLIPLLQVGDTVEDINFDALPEQFVIKLSHGSGYNYICKKKKHTDIDELKKLLSSWRNENFYFVGRERQYKNCQPKIIVETLLQEDGELTDYKLFCFDGAPRFIQVDVDRSTHHTRSFFDLAWNKLPFTTLYPRTEKVIDRPGNLDEMIEIARKLCQSFRHVRVDLYNPDGHIYFGELTFTHGNGFEPFYPDEWDAAIGSYFKLPVGQ